MLKEERGSIVLYVWKERQGKLLGVGKWYQTNAIVLHYQCHSAPSPLNTYCEVAMLPRKEQERSVLYPHYSESTNF